MHGHYFKDIAKYRKLDVYRVLRLFGVTDPSIQHAIKKLLVAGQRGVKTTKQDVAEAVDTLLRYQEMEDEDEVGLH